MKIDVVKAWNEKFKNDIKNQGFGLFLKRKLNDFLKIIDKDSRILDLGCGAGEKTFYIAKQGFDVIGIDSSREAINYAKKKFSGIKFYERNVLSTKFKGESFDAIVSIAVFHCFLKEDRKKYVKEINRILKSGGFLFQLVLSSEDEIMKAGKEIENNTYLQKTAPFHLFAEKEIREYFPNFEFLDFKHHIKKANKKKIAVYTMTLRKK